VAGDGYTMTSPAPFIVDPLDPDQLIVATCRLWRGPAYGSSWTSGNAISPMLDGVKGSQYCSGDPFIRSLSAFPLPNGTEVIYVGMYGAADGGGILAGHLFKATYSPASPSLPVWQDLTLSPVLNDQLRLNYYGLDVSSIFVDAHDPTGNTVYITIEGAEDSLHGIRILYGSTDGGAHWNELTSNLPHSPANSILIDPEDANTAYIATDQGVYSTREITACSYGPSNCWSVFGTGLPFAPVTQLSASPASTSPNVLVAGTYGRGIWQIPLWTSGIQLTNASAQPASLSFASRNVGTASTPQAIAITNTGGIALLITSIAVSPNFSETDNCVNVAVAAGASCTVQVTFTPGQSGSIAGEITVNANVPGGNIAIPLSGIGLSTGLVTALPGSLDFGSVQVGLTSAPFAVTVENAGSSAIALTGVVVSSSFDVASNACGSSLGAHSDCSISLTFTPVQKGAITGSLVLSDDAGTQTVALSGTGAAPAAGSLSITSLSFPSTAIGQLSNIQIVTLTNTGDLPLNSIAITVSAGFQQSNTCGTSLTGQASCAISVVFAPTSTGGNSGTLSVADALRTQTVALAGTGLSPAKFGLDPPQLIFPAEPIGQAGLPLALTISNTGEAPMSNVGFQIAGTSAGSFTWGTSTCGQTLNSTASCVVHVTFSPASAGQLNAVLIVTSSTNGVSAAQVPLSGIGQAPSGITVSPQQLAFTQATLGQASAPQTVTVTNTASVTATGLALTVSPPFSLVQNTCSTNLAAAGSCSTGIVFTPSANGVATGTFNVSSSAFVTAAVAVLTGNGGAAGSVQLQPVTLSFPATGVGNSSSPQTLTLTNNGAVALSGLTLSISSGFQLASTTCTATLAVGTSCLAQVLFSPASAGQQTGNLTVTSAALPASIQVPLSGTGFDFSLQMNGPASKTISSGQAASFTLVVATMSGSAGTFTFSCGTLPSNSSCAFNPFSESVAANAAGSVTVTIATGGTSSTSARNAASAPGPPFRRGCLLAIGLLMLPLAFSRRRRGLVQFIILILCAVTLTACAGAGGSGGAAPPSNSKGNTPPGAYSIQVTATANGLSRKTTMTLTVD
jgi:hypothetical protein